MAELSDDEILRRFRDLTASASLEDLRDAVGRLAGLGRFGEPPARPGLRRPPPATSSVLRVRADLKNARPPIWRRLEIRGDATLDLVHDVLQAAFDWSDTHLHRFSLGGDPFDRGSELFLCRWDVDEGEEEGTPEAQVRLDEALQEPGDTLEYVYDYGDSWDLAIRLEAVAPIQADTPLAVCTGGRRAAPPEDSGGIRDAQRLAEVCDDPAYFDPDDVNEMLSVPQFGLELVPEFRTMMETVRFASGGVAGALAVRLALAQTVAPRVRDDELTDAYRAVQWFLDRAADDGIELTGAGYLRPADVVAAAAVTPGVSHWYGKNNRETNVVPVLRLRLALQKFGLLRRHKGRVVLTRAGGRARQDPEFLRAHLVERLRQPLRGAFDDQARLLALLYAGTAADRALDFDQIAEVLTAIGWRLDEQPLQAHHLYWPEEPHLDLLRALGSDDDLRVAFHVSPAASALAHRALFVPHSLPGR